MVDAVNQREVQSPFLLRWGFPQQEGIYIQRNVFVKEWDSELKLGLRLEDAVVLSQARSNKSHLRERRARSAKKASFNDRLRRPPFLHGFDQRVERMPEARPLK